MAPNRPKVRTKVTPENLASGGVLNLDGQQRGALDLAGKDLVQPGVTVSVEQDPQGLDGAGEFGTDIDHDLQCMPPMGTVKPFGDDPQNGHMPDDEGMDKWPQRTTYRKRLKEYQDRAKKTQKDVADYLGLSLAHFRNAIYRPEKRLGVDMLSASAGLFGCGIQEFVDDPAALSTDIDLTKSNPIDRYRFNQMIQVMGDKELSDSDRQLLFEDFIRDVERLLVIKRKLAKK